MARIEACHTPPCAHRLRHQIQGPRVTRLHNPASRPNSASPPNVASGIRRHHLMQRQQFGVTTQCGFRIRRHHPMRRQETIRRQTMWRHNSASPKAMRLQEFGFGFRSFTTLPRAAALYIYIYGCHSPPPMIQANLLVNQSCTILCRKMLTPKVRIYRYLRCFLHFMYMYG